MNLKVISKKNQNLKISFEPNTSSIEIRIREKGEYQVDFEVDKKMGVVERKTIRIVISSNYYSDLEDSKALAN